MAYDETNRHHVSELAEALDNGPLVWSTEPDPDTKYLWLLTCRHPDGRTHEMHTCTRNTRDEKRFTSAVSRAILGALVSHLGEPGATRGEPGASSA